MFTPATFIDGSAGNTPITAATLNNLELGLVAADITNPASAAAVALAAGYEAIGLSAATQAKISRKIQARSVPALDLSSPSTMTTPPTFATAGPGGASPINAGTPTQLPYNTLQVTRLGCVPILYNQFGTNYHQNASSALGTPPVWAIEFDFYGDDFAVRFRTASSLVFFWVWVDGHPATAASVAPVAGNVSAGSLSFYRVTFASVALRRIRIYMTLADFGGLDIKPTQSVNPTTRNAPRIAWLGDSYVEGTSQALDEAHTFSATASRLLGMECVMAGQGGTGYTQNGGGGNKAIYGDSQRIAAITTANPDYVIVFGSINDDAVASATVGAAATALYSALATSLPSAKVIVIGPPPQGTTVPAGRTANNSAITTAASTAPNVLGIINPISDTAGQWILGTGRVGATTGDGNADLFLGADAIHPSAAGHDWYARKIAAAITGVLLTS